MQYYEENIKKQIQVYFLYSASLVTEFVVCMTFASVNEKIGIFI